MCVKPPTETRLKWSRAVFNVFHGTYTYIFIGLGTFCQGKGGMGTFGPCEQGAFLSSISYLLRDYVTNVYNIIRILGDIHYKSACNPCSGSGFKQATVYPGVQLGYGHPAPQPQPSVQIQHHHHHHNSGGAHVVMMGNPAPPAAMGVSMSMPSMGMSAGPTGASLHIGGMGMGISAGPTGVSVGAYPTGVSINVNPQPAPQMGYAQPPQMGYAQPAAMGYSQPPQQQPQPGYGQYPPGYY